jgi:diguanylate cyclase (GGDEF)-like protein/PAS domain S-box-containing protein
MSVRKISFPLFGTLLPWLTNLINGNIHRTNSRVGHDKLQPPASHRDLLAGFPDILYVFDQDGVCLDFKAGRCNPLNLDPAHVIGKHLSELGFSTQDVDQLQGAIQKTLSSQAEQACELAGPHGESQVYEVRLSRLNGCEVLAIARDITERKLDQRQLEHRALHDPLTNLPNRALFMDRLSRALEFASCHTGAQAAVLFLDLDRFKEVNDGLGHAAGDQLLRAVARRLSAALRPIDTVCRLGGDEFVILLEDVHQLGDVERIAERIQASLARPFYIQGWRVVASSSIGIALTGPGYQRADELVRDADLAMYRAKSQGEPRYAVFDNHLDPSPFPKVGLEMGLHQAVPM